MTPEQRLLSNLDKADALRLIRDFNEGAEHSKFVAKEFIDQVNRAAKATVAKGLGKTAADRLELSITLQPLTPLADLPANIVALAYVACEDRRSLRVRGGAMRQLELQGWWFGEYSGHPTATHSFSEIDGQREYFVAPFGAKGA